MVSFSSPTTTTPDGLGAFLAHSPYSLHGYAQPAASGALAGYTLGVKDLYDVAGLKTGAGSPDWLAKARDAQTHAAAVSKLIDAGVRFVGKTLTDEMAWSLNGENAHYGTPINPAARDRIPGGSSAGSASAVAGGMIDIGLGSDTGGSVRLPASYCGIWGLRPTHGRIDTSGAVALAQSFDTVGWFARCADVMAKVGAVLLPTDGDGRPVTRLLLARDMFARVDEVLRDNLVDKAEQLAQRLGWTLETIELAPRDHALGDLEAWRHVFRICQSAEAWQVHKAWVEADAPTFGPGIVDRFAYAKTLAESEVNEAKAKREAISAYLSEIIGPGTVVIAPGAAAVAPLKGQQGPVLDDIRNRALEVLVPSGLCRLPQLALPALRTAEGPLGLGLIGWAGSDEVLLEMGQQIGELTD